MTNKVFFKRVAARTGIPETDVELVIRGMRNELAAIAADPEKVNLKGFGIFHYRKRADKKVRAFGTKTMEVLKSRHYMFFKISSDLNKEIDAAQRTIKEENGTDEKAAS